MREKLTVEQAAACLLEESHPLTGREEVSLDQALGRICREDLTAVYPNPPFDRSPLDGYAVRHGDLEGASREHPAVLEVEEHVFAGDFPQKTLGPGQCARIMTGAPIPEGADCVIRQEDTDCGMERVHIYASLRAHDNICDMGEDMRAGDLLAEQGVRLTAAHIGVLAGQGLAQVPVFPRLRVGLLATGDELTPPGTPLRPGKIYNSNLAYLGARLTELGMQPVPGGHGADEPEALAAELRRLLEDCHCVLTTGGVSVGLRDALPRTAEVLGAKPLFHGVQIKPGSPVMGLLVQGKPVVCLSGNPFAAAATLEMIARPMLCAMAGWRDCAPRRAAGVLRVPFPKASPGRRLVRARLDQGEVWLPEGKHVSGALSALVGCNCLMDIPAGSPTLEAGSLVQVVML